MNVLESISLGRWEKHLEALREGPSGAGPERRWNTVCRAVELGSGITGMSKGLLDCSVGRTEKLIVYLAWKVLI